MTRKVVVIADRVTCTAFRLVGAETISVETPEETLRAIDRCRMRDDVGLVLVAQHVAEPVREEVERMAERTRVPVITFIPTRQMPGEPVDMRKLLMRALGFG